ncbi:MAG: undecaprenyl-diphosphate phosphatase [Anaerolineales bacterium]
MPLLRAALLGLLQGLAEFLPVSSSGHLVLVPWLLGWQDPGLTYSAVVHLGTLVAVVIHFWEDIRELLVGGWQMVRFFSLKSTSSRLALLILVSALPGAVLGYALESYLEGIFGSAPAAAGALLVTGCLIVLGERLSQGVKSIAQMGVSDALLMGLAQAFAIVPGISRSGATISVGLLRDFDREDATRFSFLMSIPIIVGATGYSLLSLFVKGASSFDLLPLGVGFGTAFLGGYVAIGALLRHVRSHSLRPFAYYCWVVSILSMLLCLLRR